MPDPGSGATCHKFIDEAHNVIMVLDQQITCDEASRIGRVLGSMGYSARFVSGGLAEFGAKYASWMREHGIEWQA